MVGKIKCILLAALLFTSIPAVLANTGQEPSKPVIYGPCEAKLGETCCYSVKSIDPQGDDIYYEFKFSDDPSAAVVEIGPYSSGENVTFTHCWSDFYQRTNPFTIRVKAEDENGHESEWTIFETILTNTKIKHINIIPIDFQILRIFELIFNRFHLHIPMLFS